MFQATFWPSTLLEWLQAVALVVAIVGAGGSVLQYRANSSRERKRWLFELYRRFYDDDRFQEMFRWIDYGETGFIAGGDREQLSNLDCYLNFFEFVTILKKGKELGENDVRDMFQYPLERIGQDAAVLHYLRDSGYEQLDALLKSLGYAS